MILHFTAILSDDDRLAIGRVYFRTRSRPASRDQCRQWLAEVYRDAAAGVRREYAARSSSDVPGQLVIAFD